jgi:uncharacterized cupredoxin-like copper-binding protein
MIKVYAWRALLLLLILQAVSITACSHSRASSRMNITITDFMFSPDEFTVPAGAEITIRVTQGGAVGHDLIIMEYGADAGDKFDDEDKASVYWEIDVPAESVEIAHFTAPSRPGVYQIVCGMPGHMQAGMVGKLIVVDKQ